MKLKTQLYIDTSDDTENKEANYELVDFFDFESIEITETIKNVQEVDSVFTDYTKNFVVPASRNNNKIFQHYYSTKLINSFDARIKKRARIFINGVFFKQGYLSLTSAQIKDGYPYSYTLTFFGALSGLSDILGDDKLANLDYLERYNHDYDVDTVYDGLTKGLQYNGTDMEEYSNITRDIVYPLISCQNKWFYDSQSTQADQDFQEGKSVNIYNEVLVAPDATYGIQYKQLKPAIKVANIFRAIEEKYESINIKPTSFVYGSKLDSLYLLMHNRKGGLSQGIGDTDLIRQTFLVRTSDGRRDFNYDSGEGDLTPIITYTRYEWDKQARNKTDVTFDVTISQPTSGDISYTMKILDGTKVLTSKTSTGFSDSISYKLETMNYKQWDNLRFEMSADGSVSEYSVSMTLEETYSVRSISASITYEGLETGYSSNSKQSFYTTSNATYNFPQRIEVFRQMPDMKVIDFMTGIFKMFNLVAKVDDDTGEIEILPLNDFYLTGVDRDITNYVDSFNYDVDRLQLYGNINFKYQKPTTFGLTNHNEITQDEFGDLTFDATSEGKNNNLIFDKGTYKVELPFEKLYYSRLSDEFNGALTNICEGWLVGEDQEPVKTKPVLFFNVNTTVDTNVYKFGLRDIASYISTYNRASNTISDGSLSINFGEETDEYTLQDSTNSLFNTYYKSYITNLFNKESRNIKIEAKLPLSFLFEYSLADRLLINGSPFIINEVSTNLNTGKSQLDLISAFKINLQDFVDVTPPANVVGLTVEGTSPTTISVIWNGNIETDLAGYKVYYKKTADSSYAIYTTLGTQTNVKLIGLTESTSYDIKVTAYDEAGNESALVSATSVTASTGAVTDVQAPSIPQNLRSTIIGSNAFSVAWDASIDNIGVTAYEVYLDNVLQSPDATDTMYTFTTLVPDTEYEVRVLAKDAAGNESAKSTPLTVRTIII